MKKKKKKKKKKKGISVVFYFKNNKKKFKLFLENLFTDRRIKTYVMKPNTEI